MVSYFSSIQHLESSIMVTKPFSTFDNLLQRNRKNTQQGISSLPSTKQIKNSCEERVQEQEEATRKKRLKGLRVDIEERNKAESKQFSATDADQKERQHQRKRPMLRKEQVIARYVSNQNIENVRIGRHASFDNAIKQDMLHVLPRQRKRKQAQRTKQRKI